MRPENRTQEIRVIEVGDVILHIAARAAGDGRHNEDRVVAHLVHDLPQEFQRVLEGALRRHKTDADSE